VRRLICICGCFRIPGFVVFVLLPPAVLFPLLVPRELYIIYAIKVVDFLQSPDPFLAEFVFEVALLHIGMLLLDLLHTFRDAGLQDTVLCVD
jgi:hypothetical protein